VPTDIVPIALKTRMDSWRSCAKPWVPWDYQQRGLKFMLTDPTCGLLLNPGMGKTSITLAAIKVLLKQKFIRRALIIAPLRAVYDVWPKEVCDWKDFHNLGIAILHGGKKDAVLRALQPEHQICIINPEGCQWLTASKERLKLLGADMVVFDESSKWKAPNTVRFKAMRKVLGMFKRRHILTGSPRPRNYEDLFGQIYILDRGATLGDYISHYRNRFFFPTGYMMREWELLPGKDKEINALVAPMVLRLDAKDYLKLPTAPDQFHEVELPAKVQTQYDQIEDSMLSVLFSEPLTHSAAARSKCAQIANGAVYTDAAGEDHVRQRPYKQLHTAKVDALVDLYEELQGEPLLLSIGYHHDVDCIRAALNKDIPCINGNTTRGQATEFIERWNKGLLPLLMMHPASAGHGLNLQGCSCRNVGFFDIPDDYDLYDQTFCRVWRQGNKAKFVFRHHFITKRTVDVAKMRNLKKKGTGQRAFLDAMKAYAEEKERS
jgi:SNF2 family DNA or RNA helicase